MAISDYSTTAASNTTISGIDISGTTGKVKDGDNAIRQLMADIKAGVPYLSTNFLMESTDAGATAGPVLEFYRNSATPAASDILGKLLFNGEDSAGNTQEYASIETVIVDATSTSEDGQLDFYVTKAGARTKFLSMTATAVAHTAGASYSFDAVLTPAASDGAALGTSSLMWSDLFLASGAVINFNNGDVLITHSADTLAFTGATEYRFNDHLHVRRNTDGWVLKHARSDDTQAMGIQASGHATPIMELWVAGAAEVGISSSVLYPTTSDGTALGTGSFMWSDLFLASGAVINFNNGDVTETHSANALAWAGASSGYSFDAPVTGTQFKLTSTIFWSQGAGSPEGAVTANIGALYSRSDGGATTTLYVKTSGTGNTGWTGK
jgi:CRISPR/Cas system-associated exonuclease Cas4 (RecB family)